MNRTKSSLHRAHSRSSFARLIFESEHSYGGGHHDRDILFRCCQLFVLLFRLVTPFSYVFLVTTAYLWFHEMSNVTTAAIASPRWQLLLIADWLVIWIREMKSNMLGWVLYHIVLCWMTAEAMFFPYYYHLFNQMQDLNDQLPHHATDSATRMRLVKNCFEALKTSTIGIQREPELYLRQVIEGWFLDEPIINIYRANFSSWSAFAFFGKDLQEMTSEEIEENKEIVEYIETMIRWKFPPGLNPQVPPVRLNLDPLFATQRPFFFYATIAIVNTLCHLILKYILGYQYLQQYDTPMRSQRIYYRPGTRSSNSSGRCKPVVFVHGIGIGFAHYLAVIASMPRDVDIYLVEWPYVSMQMVARGPSNVESVEALTAALEEHGHHDACFVAHSLGTVLVSWMMQDASTSKRVASSVLLDPVTFLLCDPTVATMFVYKDPTNTIDFLMHFFLSRELFIANALSRYFAWSLNIMFVEDLQRNKHQSINHDSTSSPTHLSSNSSGTIDHTIFLSSHDVIVPIGPLSRYLSEKATALGDDANFEVMMFHGTHGEMMLYPSWVSLINQKVKERCGVALPTKQQLKQQQSEEQLPQPSSWSAPLQRHQGQGDDASDCSSGRLSENVGFELQ